jgi:hypothetical protein
MSAPQRVAGAWRGLHPDQRLAGLAAVLLLLSMFLPWYDVTTNFVVQNRPGTESSARSAFQVYSFVEAAIFLVAIGVIALLFFRGEKKAFHLPGGDGSVILAAGLWVTFLIFYRQFDKPGVEHSGPVSGTVGVQWGIFIAFLLGALLAYAGWRIRTANIGEPPADDLAPRPPSPRRGAGAAGPDPARRPRRRPDGASAPPPPVEGQLTFDEAHHPAPEHLRGAPRRPDPTPTPRADESPTSVAWEEPPTRRARRRDVFERPADPDEPSEFDPPRRRGR